ncbi:MAG: hypothetical protein WCG93_06195 [Paludibacter sp.]
MLKRSCLVLILVLLGSLNVGANKRPNSHILKEKRASILKTLKLVADWQMANLSWCFFDGWVEIYKLNS